MSVALWGVMALFGVVTIGSAYLLYKSVRDPRPPRGERFLAVALLAYSIAVLVATPAVFA